MLVADKLKLVKPVGEGGMGAVWVARNTATGANVAVKVLRPDRMDAESEARFRHEARLGATLAHRNITRVFDLLTDDDGSLVLVMELLAGETLRSYTKRVTAVPTQEAVAIMVGVLAGLQHAHEHGVVHRDLKPTNIFLHVDSDGQMTPKLLDFGIAKAKDSSVDTKTGEVLGTPSYMSPEQVRGKELDGRSDLFGVAVVLYELIVGQSPFPGPTATAILAQVLELEVDPDPRIDSQVWLEIQRSLSKQAYERHPSAKDLSSALASAVGETEAGLARSLTRDVQSLPKIDPFDAGPPTDLDRTAVTGPRTMQMANRPRRFHLTSSMSLALVAAGTLTLIVSLVVILARSPRREGEPRKPTERIVVSDEPAPSSSEEPAPPGDPSADSTLELPANATHPGGRRRPRAPAKPAGSTPRSVARTPGF
jgi:serine/threonine-protein kinase